jgi:hypothetical protein
MRWKLTSASVRTNVFVLLLENASVQKNARVLLTDLTDPFITRRTLDEKPKIFFCDLCRGGNREPEYAKEMSTLLLEEIK